ncbi:MAG: acyltransferase [Muribaculaceae bacterium]
MRQERQSNIELLRIISMLFILVVHFDGAALGLPAIMNFADLQNFGVVSKEVIEAISIIGVNCFVLISGYFGIKFSIKGLVKFTLWCLFYSVIIFIVKSAITPGYFTAEGLLCSFLVYSHTDLWFLPAYLGLYLLSPLLNMGIESFSKRSFQWCIIAVLFLNVYLGWLQEGKINPTGYNVMQMIMVYLIGRYIGLYWLKDVRNKPHLRFIFIAWYINFTILIFISAFYLNSGKAFAYNSPFVLAASVCFFLIFTTFKFHNVAINYVATSAFAVYLIHKSPVVWLLLKDTVAGWATTHGYLGFSVRCIGLIIAVYALCIAIDKVRERITDPVSTRIAGWIAGL